MFSRKIILPTTLDGFDALVDRLVKKYKFADRHHTAAILSVAIRHLPQTEAHATLEYFGNYINKNLANYVANHKGQMLQHEAQIDQLVSLLKQDPADNQARDSLEKAAGEGSAYAANALKLIAPMDNPFSAPETVVSN
jgi:hypothetical protein